MADRNRARHIVNQACKSPSKRLGRGAARGILRLNTDTYSLCAREAVAAPVVVSSRRQANPSQAYYADTFKCQLRNAAEVYCT